MIFKDIDDKTEQLKVLENLYNKSQSESQKKLIKSELSKIKYGFEAEKENAYYLDFEFKDSNNIILLHDIRIEHNGRTAQLDHLLISRFGIELLETKSAKGSITINEDGSISYKYGKYKNTSPNPIEQSKRHALVLREFIEDNELLSKRISLLGGIDISSKVLIHPKTNVTNKRLPDGYERADSFISSRRKEINSTGILTAYSMLSKMYTIDKAKEIAQLLVDSHSPIKYDYVKKYKIKKESIQINNSSNEEKLIVCPKCNNGQLVIREAKSKKAQEKYDENKFLGCSTFPKCRYTEMIK